MIFYDAFSMGPLKKSSKIGKRVQFSLSLSPHKKKRANKHHHHQIMEVADIAIAPLKEFVRDSARLVKKCTKPDRREFTLIASKTAFGASSRSFSSSSSSLSFFAGLTKKRSLSTSFKTRQGLSCLGSSGSS